MSKWLVFFKRTQKYDFNQILLSKSLVFHEWKSKWAIRSKKTSNLLICSFIMSDQSKSLRVTLLSWATWAVHSFTVALLTWVTWVIPLQSLICPERSERIAHSRSWQKSDLIKWANERWANERIPNPGHYTGCFRIF